jgi:hypothetical protein
VSTALASNGYPPVEHLTRDQYYSKLVKTKEHFDAVLDALARALGMTFEELYELFCVKLEWCKRRRDWSSGWNRAVERAIGLVPSRFRQRFRYVAAAAPWVRDWISIFVTLSTKVSITLFLMKFSAFLAIRGLDRLCGC